MTDEKMNEHGYYEVYMPVWDGSDMDTLTNMVVDIYGDEETLNSINDSLLSEIESHGKDENINTMSQSEQFFIKQFRPLLNNGLIMDVGCSEFGIDTIDDLIVKLDNDGFEFYEEY
jgi:hypothetical protein